MSNALKGLNGVAALVDEALTELPASQQERIQRQREVAALVNSFDCTGEGKTINLRTRKAITVDPDTPPVVEFDPDRPRQSRYLCPHCDFKSDHYFNTKLHMRKHQSPPEGSKCSWCGESALHLATLGRFSCKANARNCPAFKASERERMDRLNSTS